MNIVLNLNQLLDSNNNNLYIGDYNQVIINDVKYPFIKGYLHFDPKVFKHSCYKNTSNNNATYIIQEIYTNKIYIGSSKEIYIRINGHKTNIRNNYHQNINFYNLLETTNIKNFQLIIIFTETREEAYNLEQYLINIFNKDNLLNIADDVKSPMLGKNHSEESKQLMSEFHKNDEKAINRFKEILNSKKRQVMVDGIEYDSLTQAGIESNLSESFIRRSLVKNDNPNIYWLSDNVSPIKGKNISNEQKQKLSIFRKTNLDAKKQLDSIRVLTSNKILVNDILFNSVLEAVRVTNISEATIHRYADKTKDVYILNYSKPVPKKVIIDGIVYNGLTEASNILGINRTTLKGRVRSGSIQYYE